VFEVQDLLLSRIVSVPNWDQYTLVDIFFQQLTSFIKYKPIYTVEHFSQLIQLRKKGKHLLSVIKELSVWILGNKRYDQTDEFYGAAECLKRWKVVGREAISDGWSGKSKKSDDAMWSTLE